jgi:integrase
MTKSTKPNTAQWTLRKYLEEIFIPDKLAAERWTKEKGAYWPRLYRTMINQFVEHCGREVKCREVTEAMIAGFIVWMSDHGFREKSGKTYTYALRAILRQWNPEKFHTAASHELLPVRFIDADLSGTLEQIFLDQYVPENPRVTSQKTLIQYGIVFRQFTEFLGHVATLADLSDANVCKFMRWRIEVCGNKPVSARNHGKRLKAVWNWAAKKRMVDLFPTFANLPVPESIPTAWTREELHRLMAACRKAKGRIGRIPAADFWVAYHLVLWDSLERRGAVNAMRWDWVDLRRGFISVPAEFRKGGMKAMVYSIKPETIEALKAIRGPERELVFGTSWSETSGTSFYDHYKKLILSAGLPYVKQKSGPQKMRRSGASHLEAAGGNATRALRHSDRRTTEQSYLDPRICELEPENKKLFPLDGDAA